MASRWMGRRVSLRYMDGGEWEVIALDGPSAGCKALTEVAKTLASFTPDGVVWFQKRDLQEVKLDLGEALL